MKRPLIVAASTVAVALVVAVIVLVVGQTRPGSATPAATLTGHSWTLTRIVVDGNELIVSDTNPITLSFHSQDQTVSGGSGCNAYGGSYTVTGNQIKFADMRSTLMYCSNAGVMELEAAYLDALSRVETYHIVGDTLTLEGAGGQIYLAVA